MKTITAKQIAFINNLVRETRAYDGTDGMVTLDGVYPRLNLTAAQEGECSSYEASKIINVLINATKAYTDEQCQEMRQTPTLKQCNYAEMLAKKAGREINLDGMTRKEVSELIDELLNAPVAA
nr:MAG TPA: Protein of unknown function (DUF3072) [Caudoviricetes sp.]